MNEFRFAQIDWLFAFWAVLAMLILLVLLELRGAKALERMLSIGMQTRLVRKPSLTRRLLAVVLFSSALCALVVSLMRPQWGTSIQAQTRVDSQIMVCLDVSKSMLAEDVVPNRLDRAKAEIDSLLSLLNDGQQVGLLAFAGKARVLCPLTTDFGFLRLVLAEAGPSTVGLGGTRIGEAVQVAVDGFREAGDVNRLILLITDGEDHDSFPLDAAQAAREKGVRIISIGFGDEAGSKIAISDPRTGTRAFVQDRNRNDVISRLDGETLRDMALETEGAYIPAGTGALDLQSIYDSHIASLLRGTTTTEEQTVRNEAYQWCLLAALVLLIIALATPLRFPGAPQLHTPINEVSKTQTAAGLAAAVLVLVGCSTLQPRLLAAENLPEAPSPSIETNRPRSLVESSPAQIPGEADAEFLAIAEGTSAPNTSAPNIESEKLTPRESYNLALAFIQTEPDKAERLLNESRREAGVDGELRFRSLYNLGWVDIARADRLLSDEPEKSLQHLQMAASRFREAVRVRPESQEARHNLEILSLRILQLNDALAKRAPQDLPNRLDESILAIREHLTNLQRLVMRIRPEEFNLEQYRGTFRQLGVTERQLISDLEKLTAEIRQEQTALQSANQEATDEDRLRLAQLTALVPYLDSGLQRMHKARSFTRRLQSDRALVRWSAGLSDVKRARDQLRDPVEILSLLTADASEVRDWTRVLAHFPTQQLSSADSIEDPLATSKPVWLTLELLSQSQTAITERTGELESLFISGVQQTADDLQDEETQGAADHGSATILKKIQNALPALMLAKTHFQEADARIEQSLFIEAVEQQMAGINALMEAAEFFFDVRRLIEVAYQDERQVQSIVQQLAAIEQQPESAEELPLFNAMEPDSTASAIQTQTQNLARALRLEQLLQQDLSTAKTNLEQNTPSSSEEEQADFEAHSTVPPSPNERTTDDTAAIERLKFALRLLTEAREAMSETATGLAEYSSRLEPLTSANPTDGHAKTERPPSPSRFRTDPESMQTRPVASDDSPKPATASDSLPQHQVATAVEKLAELRRLFFSVVEHLRETAQRQSELNDATSDMLSNPQAVPSKQVGPLAHRQQTLQQIAVAIADALNEQAQQQLEQTPSEQDPLDSPSISVPGIPSTAAKQDTSAVAAKFSEAANRVDEGQRGMQQVIQRLKASASPLHSEKNHTFEGTENSDLADESQGPDEISATPTPAELNEVINDQQLVLQHLLEALKLLNEPQPENDEQQTAPQDSQDDQSSQQQEEAQQQEETQLQQRMNAAQMLQAIRDREAQRRQEKQREAQVSSSSVEKDW